MNKLVFLNDLSKEAIQKQIDAREWIDGRRLTRQITKDLKDFVAKMPEPTNPELVPFSI